MRTRSPLARPKLSGHSCLPLSICALLALGACAPKLSIEKERVRKTFEIARPIGDVETACPRALAEFLGEKPVDRPIPCGEIVSLRGRDYRELSISYSCEGGFILCTLHENVLEGAAESGSGKAEQWNLILDEIPSGTRLTIHRLFRWEKLGLPISDGVREAEFVANLEEVLGNGK